MKPAYQKWIHSTAAITKKVNQHLHQQQGHDRSSNFFLKSGDKYRNENVNFTVFRNKKTTVIYICIL